MTLTYASDVLVTRLSPLCADFRASDCGPRSGRALAVRARSSPSSGPEGSWRRAAHCDVCRVARGLEIAVDFSVHVPVRTSQRAGAASRVLAAVLQMSRRCVHTSSYTNTFARVRDSKKT